MAQEKKLYQLTKEGKQELETRLNELITVIRPANIEAIKAARSQGDLSENADYSAAREEQGKIEAEIRKLTDILEHCTVIKADSNSPIALGKTVVIKLNGIEKEYTIVSTIESDPVNGKISNESLLGSKLLAISGEDAKDLPYSFEFLSDSGRNVKVELLSIK